ncbi:hypothetical protein V7S43_004975 [Phytophthora oleae]|uniref:Uncharacterized protein n=1 Tax=Phytophthora oleae TaxID=2107226 RepID=A0ABD3FV83_9STRA
MSSAKVIKSGVTTFESRKESFRFAISDNGEGKVNILLEGQRSRKQWCTGYLAMDQYVTNRNSIGNVGVKGYAELFLEMFQFQYSNDDDDSSDDDSSDDDSDSGDDDRWGGSFSRKIVRTLLAMKNDGLQLDLSIKFTVPGGSWTVNYKFHLEAISLERVRALEAKVRDLEEELAAQIARDTNKRSPETAEESDGEMVHVDLDLEH